MIELLERVGAPHHGRGGQRGKENTRLPVPLMVTSCPPDYLRNTTLPEASSTSIHLSERVDECDEGTSMIP